MKNSYKITQTKQIKTTINLLLLSLLLWLCTLNISIVFAHTADIDITSAGDTQSEYISVPIAAQMYKHCRPDFGDIRIYDADGSAVPYFIQSLTPTASTQISESFYPLRQSDSFVKDGYLYLDYTLTQDYPSDICATSLEFKSSSDNFAKSARLYGSYDGMVWTYIQEDNIYSVEDSQKLSFNFSKPLKYTHYRAMLSDSGENPHFTDCILHFRGEISEVLNFSSVTDAEYTTEEIGKTTVVHLPSLKNMQLDYIEIETDDMFKRRVSYSGGSQILQRLTFGSGASVSTISDTTLKLNGMTAPEDFSITINNGDNAPLNIKRINAAFYENYIIFKPSKPPYRAEFGDITLSKPVYDIESYKNEVLSRPLAVSEFSDIKITEPAPESGGINTRLIFNITLCAAAVMLIILLIAALKKN